MNIKGDEFPKDIEKVEATCGKQVVQNEEPPKYLNP